MELDAASTTNSNDPSQDSEVLIQERILEMYIDDLAAILKISPGAKNLLGKLIKRIDSNGIIALKTTIRKELALQLHITNGTFNNYLTKLLEVGAITRISRGHFQANPYLLTVQEWAKTNRSPNQGTTSNLRLTVTYLPSGEKKIESTQI